ncbi:hypothetical protein B0H66DRAFT_537360 [Apodospora peruviana]|uniref:Uncharacterized protein n=1 Tax=Apodospora peruviana TaxID=516989 RepID=A0AAE0HWA7_9PEZI|nr:hypothetical protein B0H66DRAFT_537360 [Apodospora peruviana]
MYSPITLALGLLAITLSGWTAVAQTTTDGPNFASWSSHMAAFPLETYCPETASNPLESEYEDCRSTAWNMVYSCPSGQEDASSRTVCICSSIIAMSSCLSAYCPSNTVQASIISQDQDDFTSIYGCPSRLGAAGGGGGGGGSTPATATGDTSSVTGTPSPSKNVGAGRMGTPLGGGNSWTAAWMGLVAGGFVGVVAVVL